MLVVVGVVGPHRVEPGVKVRIAHLAAAGDGRLGVTALDQHGREQQVVGAAGTGRARRKRRAGRLQHVHQVGRHGRGHETRHHGRDHATHVLAGLELLLNLDMRGHVAGPRPHHDGHVAPLEPRLRQRPARRGQRQTRLPPQKASLGLGHAHVRVGELALILPRDLAPALQRHAGGIRGKGRVAPFTQHRFDSPEVIAEVTQHPGARHDHLAVAVARTPIAHLVCAVLLVPLG